MRIDLNYAPQAASETNRSSVQNAATGSSAGTDLGEDQAQLSGAHVQVQALATLASQMPDVRQERVQSLRHAVVNGQYQVRPDEVAGALLAHLTAERAA